MQSEQESVIQELTNTGKAPATTKRIRTRPKSLDMSAVKLNSDTCMMGTVYAFNPHRANPLNLRYCLSSNPKHYEEDYNLKGMPDGLFVYIKTKADRSIKTPKGYCFPPGTIICREKRYLSEPTAHSFLARQMNLSPDKDIDAAGLILVKTGKTKKIEEWNSRTGTYYKSCKLDEENAYKKVGLPESAFSSEGHKIPHSPLATRQMVLRHYQPGEELPPSLREEPPQDAKTSHVRRGSTTMMLDSVTPSSQDSLLPMTSASLNSQTTGNTDFLLSSSPENPLVHSSSPSTFNTKGDEIPETSTSTPQIALHYSQLGEASSFSLPEKPPQETFHSRAGSTVAMLSSLTSKSPSSGISRTPPAQTSQVGSSSFLSTSPKNLLTDSSSLIEIPAMNNVEPQKIHSPRTPLTDAHSFFRPQTQDYPSFQQKSAEEIADVSRGMDYDA